MLPLDQIDYRILALIQENGRAPQAEIGTTVGLSQPAVAERIRKLEERGAILGYVARLDAATMGNDIRAFIGVRISHPRHHVRFVQRIRELPEVLECHRVAGLDSYLIKVVAENTERLDRLISDTLRRIAGVTRTHTTVVLSAVKEEGRVPLPRLVEAAPRTRRKEKRT